MTIPASVKKIEGYAFGDTPLLKEVIYDGGDLHDLALICALPDGQPNNLPDGVDWNYEWDLLRIDYVFARPESPWRESLDDVYAGMPWAGRMTPQFQRSKRRV